MTPSPDALLPPIGPRQELVLLARTLLLEGYNDHLAGHITYKQPDGTFLVNPWPLVWDEFGPDDVIVMNEHGEKLSGAWQVPLGIPLHVALHQLRPDVVVSVHNHPLYATTYANAKRVPPPYDQSSALGGGTVVLVDEYTTAVNDVNAAQSAAQAMGSADMALLANHGVMVTGVSIRAAHQRAVALEQRCKHAWHVEAIGGGSPLTQVAQERSMSSDGNQFIGFWEAMARREIRRDPSIIAGAPR